MAAPIDEAMAPPRPIGELLPPLVGEGVSGRSGASGRTRAGMITASQKLQRRPQATRANLNL